MKTKFNFRFLALTLAGIFVSFNVWAQDIMVKGLVEDTFGDPVTGANVVVKGTTNGTITDLDGNFSLKAPKGSTLLVTFIGYKAQEVAAAPTLKVVMSEDSELLDDVVVIGYGAVKKNDMTGSVVALKAEEINRGAVTSPDQMLKGKVPGLMVTSASGDPTEGAKMRIRGAASLYASNDPLVIIDGVPMTGDGAGMANPLATVNPNDIESYTVLKDASATAIYGSRASNGVIMITTKKGKMDGVKVNYSSSYSIKNNIQTMDVLNAEQYKAVVEAAGRASDVAPLLGNADTDWQSQIYRTAFTTDQNVSVTGKVKNLPFRVSGGYTYDQATLKVGENQRANLSVGLTPTFLEDHLSLNINAKGVYNKAVYTNSGAIGSALAMNPTISVSEADNAYLQTFNGYTNWALNGAANTQVGSARNPLSQLYDSHNENNSWRSMGNLQTDYKIHGFEDLRLNLNLGYDFARTHGETYNKIGSFASSNAGKEDYYKDYANQNSTTLLEFYANYNKEINGEHRLDVMAGYSWQHSYRKYKNEQYYNSQALQDDFDNEKNKPENLYLNSPTDRSEYYLVSFFGRVNYSFLGRYLLTFTLRDDASSRFSSSNRWGLFPSAAAAWNIGEEDWIKNIDAISSMKLRLGWGQTGQQDIGDKYYYYQPIYNVSTSLTSRIPWGSGYAYTLAPSAYNPDIKWETTTTTNIGLDFGFIDGRINGSIDAYLRKTTDLLNEVVTPLGQNYSNTILSNIGEMENKGIEFNVNVIPFRNKYWHWSVGFNGTFQQTKITELNIGSGSADYLGAKVGATMNSNEGFTSLYRKGYTPYTYYLYQQLYDENGKPIQNAAVDRNKDGKIDDSDRYVTGKSISPKFYYGLNTEVTYKNWSLGLNAHGAVGGYALNKVKKNNSTSYSDDYGKSYLGNYTTYVLETGWTKSNSTCQDYSDMYLENASYFKIDDINLSYTFDKIANWKGSIRVGASVQNVCTVTKYSGLDPELTATDGVDNNLIPRPQVYTLRLNVSF